MNGTVQPSANDIFVDSFIANTFSLQDAHGFLMSLLGRPDFLPYYKVVHPRRTMCCHSRQGGQEGYGAVNRSLCVSGVSPPPVLRCVYRPVVGR